MREIPMISYKPIGIIHTPYNDPKGMPIQSMLAEDLDKEGYVELFPEYTAGLKDLEGFSHIILIYHFHKVKGYELVIKPFLEEKPHGIFAIRAPKRPNPIGLSIVEVVEISDNIITFKNPDMLDGTPLLDIKPYIKFFDIAENSKAAWLEYHKEDMKKTEKIIADDRYKS